MGIIAVFFSIAGFYLSRSVHSSYISTTLDTFLSDLKNQQIKAMTGDTGGGSAADNYGIHFASGSYTLFSGTWSSTSSGNFVVSLPSTTQISDFFPNHELIFLKGTGEVAGCCTGSSFSVTFNDSSSNIQKTVTVNRFGATTVN